MSRFLSTPENLHQESNLDQTKLQPKRSFSLRRYRRSNLVSNLKHENDDSGMCSTEDFSIYQKQEKAPDKKLPLKKPILIGKKLEMPSLLEHNESSKNDVNAQCTILIDECEEPVDLIKSTSNLLDYKGNLLEYLVKNQKNFSTNSTIANIATAAAANSDQDPSCQSQNFLETLMDLMQPPLAITSQFDLSSNASNDPIDFELTRPCQKFQVESALIDNSSTLNQKKQVNDQIMMNCLDYLDYINKKHNHDRHIQIIRNKISGFILLTGVFMIIFSLAILVFYSMSHVIAKSNELSSPNPSFINLSVKKNSPNAHILEIEIDFFLRNIFMRINATKVNQDALFRLKNYLLDDLQSIFGHETNLTDPYRYFKHAISDFS